MYQAQAHHFPPLPSMNLSVHLQLVWEGIWLTWWILLLEAQADTHAECVLRKDRTPHTGRGRMQVLWPWPTACFLPKASPHSIFAAVEVFISPLSWLQYLLYFLVNVSSGKECGIGGWWGVNLLIFSLSLVNLYLHFSSYLWVCICLTSVPILLRRWWTYLNVYHPANPRGHLCFCILL